jgi:hypothetical protein
VFVQSVRKYPENREALDPLAGEDASAFGRLTIVQARMNPDLLSNPNPEQRDRVGETARRLAGLRDGCSTRPTSTPPSSRSAPSSTSATSAPPGSPTPRPTLTPPSSPPTAGPPITPTSRSWSAFSPSTSNASAER